MKLNKNKIEIAMANKKLSIAKLSERYGASRSRINVIMNSRNVTPATAGRLADALEVDVTEIIED